jgi:SNF2 family DNA or RNA helicase
MAKFGELSTHTQVEKLQETIRPYMLRRLKEVVDRSIPAKEETIIDVELTTLQKKVYHSIFYDNKAYLMKGVSKSNMPKLINVEMELRKVTLCLTHLLLLSSIVFSCSCLLCCVLCRIRRATTRGWSQVWSSAKWV